MRAQLFAVLSRALRTHRLTLSLCRPWALLALAPVALAQPVPSSSAQLSGNDNILSIEYRCADKTSVSHSCSISVSKNEFDALVQALDPNMTVANRQALAYEYSRLLIMAAEARRRRLDRSPELQTLVAFSTLQLLANRLIHEITSSPRPITAAEVEIYFREHQRDFQEVTLNRIFVPVQSSNARSGTVSAADQTAVLHKRAVAGEDFEVLQREVSGEPAGPNGRIASLPCRLLPEAHRHVCDLAVGEISTPQADKLGYSIYRMESRRSVEFEDVREQVRAMLEQQRQEQEIQQVRTPTSLQLDEQYFGQLPPPDLAKQHGLHNSAVSLNSPSKPAKQHQH